MKELYSSCFFDQNQTNQRKTIHFFVFQVKVSYISNQINTLQLKLQLQNLMKQRLNLDTLLKKYQQNYGLSSPNVPRVEPKPLHKIKTEASCYQPNHHYYQTTTNLRPQVVVGTSYQRFSNTNFQMSRSQCQNLLMSLRAQLKSQQQNVEEYITGILAQMMDAFQRQHQELRKQLLSMVQSALDSNRRLALEILQGYRSKLPRQYASIHKAITSADSDITRLLASLNGAQYKRTIAEVVTQDFSHLLKTIKQEVRLYGSQIQESLRVGVRVDKNKLNSIQQQFQRLYIWDDPVVRAVPEEREIMGASRRSSRQKIFDSRQRYDTEKDDRSDRSAPKPLRRTFFNFDQQS